MLHAFRGISLAAVAKAVLRVSALPCVERRVLFQPRPIPLGDKGKEKVYADRSNCLSFVTSC